jgi:hypothetical protein
MEDTIVEPEIITAETESNSGTEASAPSPVDEIDALISEFEQKTAEAEQAAAPDSTPVSDDELNNLLSGLDADKNRVTELEGQLNSLRSEVFVQQELAAIDKFCGEVQAQCGVNVPEDYAKHSLLSMAATDANLMVAWQYRGLTNEQLAQADREFRELEALHYRAMQTPDNGDPPRQQAIAWMEQRGAQLDLMMNSRAILTNARRSVVKRAESQSTKTRRKFTWKLPPLSVVHHLHSCQKPQFSGADYRQRSLGRK